MPKVARGIGEADIVCMWDSDPDTKWLSPNWVVAQGMKKDGWREEVFGGKKWPDLSSYGWGCMDDQQPREGALQRQDAGICLQGTF